MQNNHGRGMNKSGPLSSESLRREAITSSLSAAGTTNVAVCSTVWSSLLHCLTPTSKMRLPPCTHAARRRQEAPYWSVCLGAAALTTMLGAGLLACFWWLQPRGPPNIIIILADDLGWNDVSFHGSNQFMTPNIDALAYSGVILQDYYTQPICTPSRAALLTGRHPISNGMEHSVIFAPQPWGLPLTERLLPQYLQDLGYTSRAVGKWHLGFFKANYTPSRRGFDSHYGMWLGHQDHYSHKGEDSHSGFDFHRDLNVSWEATGRYSTELFTEEAERLISAHDASHPLFLYLAYTAPHAPVQAPLELIRRFSYIQSKKRQIYAAMVTALDESMGRVVAALRHKNMLDNSIILFLSDNGGATHGFNHNVASNWPLRGCKDTLWEGGVRVVGCIWSPLLRTSGRVHRGLVNVQDWLPTLLEAAGTPTDVSQLDGVSQWKALNNEAKPPYTTMLHNIDLDRAIVGLRHGDWKLVIGSTYGGYYDGFYGKLAGKVPYDLETLRGSKAGTAIEDSVSPLPSDPEILQLRLEATVSCTRTSTEGIPHVTQIRQVQDTDSANEVKTTGTSEAPVSLNTSNPLVCMPHISPCLFNLKDDPCEKRNLASENPEVLDQLMAIMKRYRPVPANNQPDDPRSYPENWNNTWTTWQDFL